MPTAASQDSLPSSGAPLRARVDAMEAEVAEARRHLQAVRADHFRDRVINDIHAVLPEASPLRVR